MPISFFYNFYKITVGILFGNLEIIMDYLLNRFYWLKLWLLLRIAKFEVLSYIILIKLAWALFRLEDFHRSYEGGGKVVEGVVECDAGMSDGEGNE